LDKFTQKSSVAIVSKSIPTNTKLSELVLIFQKDYKHLFLSLHFNFIYNKKSA